MILSSFSRTYVRPAVVVPVNIAIDSFLAAFTKLNHAIAGLYLCVRLRWQESAH